VTRRAAVAAGVLALTLASLAPAAAEPVDVATPAGEVGALVRADGPPASVEPDLGASPGDSALTVRESVQDIEVTWRGAPGDLVEVQVGLRGARVAYPVFTTASALTGGLDTLRPALPDGAPWPYVGPEGIDASYEILVLHHGPDDRGWPFLPYPDHWFPQAVPWGVGYEAFTTPAFLDDSSDRTVAWVGKDAADVCAFGTEAGSLDAGLCLNPSSALAAVTPEVRLHSELQDVAVRAREAARDTAAHAADARAGAEPSAAMTAGEAGLALAATDPVLGPVLFTLPPAASPASGPAPPLPAAQPQTASGAVLAALPPGAGLPLALAALALLAPILALYRRILPSRALGHPVREAMVRHIRDHPGEHESQLARALGLRHSHVQYHLRVLEDSRIVETRRFGGLKCLFETGRLSEAEKGSAMAERGRGPEVLAAVHDEPGIAQRALARRLGMSESSVKWHLDRLAASGIVRTERARGAKRAWPVPGMLALAAHRVEHVEAAATPQLPLPPPA
jgi:DNA-binding transcriptional ArsR family regulator